MDKQAECQIEGVGCRILKPAWIMIAHQFRHARMIWAIDKAALSI